MSDEKDLLAKNKLFDQLTRDLKPTKLARAAASASVFWWSFSLVSAALMISLVRIRGNLEDEINQAGFLCSIATLLMTAGLAAFFAFQNGIPGKVRSEKRMYLVVALFLVALAPYLSILPLHLDAEGFRCSVVTAFASLVPAGVFLFFLKKKYAVTRARTTGYFLGFASGAWGCVTIAFHCASTDSAHVLVWHFAPVVLLSWCFSRIAIRVLRF